MVQTLEDKPNSCSCLYIQPITSNLNMQSDREDESKRSMETGVQSAVFTSVNQYHNVVIHYALSLKDMCMVTLACPLVSVLTCLITGCIFQFDDIHETHCQVYNIIPSLSAITGISPQKYLWRVSVAVHVGPRLLITAVTRSYHQNEIDVAANWKAQAEARKWINLAFWLQLVEIGCLTGVTYISNRENYPAHEKLFITFMVSSILHMWASIQSTLKVAETKGDVDRVREKIKFKKKLLAISIASIVGIIGFFLQHRYLCHNMAFSWFALCEYVFAIANITFHFALLSDFPNEHLVVGKGFKID